MVLRSAEFLNYCKAKEADAASALCRLRLREPSILEADTRLNLLGISTIEPVFGLPLRIPA